MKEQIQKRLEEKKKQGQYRSVVTDKGISFCHNDYLGFSQHERVKEAGIEAIHSFGTGSRGSRLLGGNTSFMERIEEEVADFFGAPACLFFSSGYLANLASVQTAALLVDEIWSDEKNHASLIDGVRLSGKPKTIVPHLQWTEALDSNTSPKLIISESLFSMDADSLPSPAFSSFFKNSNHYVILDEAHAIGVFEKEGKGLLLPQIPDWNACSVTLTFGKAFGLSGACILCSKEMKELLINEARSFIFTTAPPPFLFFQVREVLALFEEESWRREALWERAIKVRKILSRYGLTVLGMERSPIIPILVGGNTKALQIAENMREKGVEVKAIRHPAVALGTERLRLSLSLLQTEENTEAMAEEIGRICREFL